RRTRIDAAGAGAPAGRAHRLARHRHAGRRPGPRSRPGRRGAVPQPAAAGASRAARLAATRLRRRGAAALTTTKETAMSLTRRQLIRSGAAIAAGAAAPLLWAADTIKLGYVSPQTGPLAPFGESDK